eukprot:6335179-Lingulodinium_polyedra.AAC.1
MHASHDFSNHWQWSVCACQLIEAASHDVSSQWPWNGHNVYFSAVYLGAVRCIAVAAAAAALFAPFSPNTQAC